MGEFRNIRIKQIKSEGAAEQGEYPWYRISFTLSRAPDKLWAECFDEAFRQRMGRFADQLTQYAERTREEIPSNSMRVLAALGLVGGIKLTDEAAPSTGSLYELHEDVLTLRCVYGGDCVDGTEAARKCLPDVKELVSEANAYRKIL